MSKTPNIFVRSLRELRSTRCCLAVTALLIAINVTLDLLGLSIKAAAQPAYRLRLPVQCVDRHAVRPRRRHDGRRAPTCSATLRATCPWARISGLYADSRCRRSDLGPVAVSAQITVWRAIGAKTCINLFCNICLNTLWLTVTGGKAMSVLLVTRVPKTLFCCRSRSCWSISA